ncbi:MAG: AarF/ABC1/UbiB kinase family protein [Pseudomonadota bacterium]
MAKPRLRVPTGRLRRLGKVAALAPRAGVLMAGEVLRHAAGEDPTERVGEVLFATLGELKAGSLKLGQLFAQVSDGLPEAMRVRLGRLFSRAPTLPWEAVAEVLAAELGPNFEDRFASFEHEPFAGASLGQVHRATLHDGTMVAVKVQYPGVAEALQHDLDVVGGLAGSITGGGMLFDTAAYLTAFRADTLAELDYRVEVARLERVAAVVAGWPGLLVPRVHREVCSERVLTCDFLEGPTLHERFEAPGAPAERRALGFGVVRAVLGPLFAAGVINADAHPGNFVVLADGRLGLLDFGAVTAVPAELVDGIAALALALMLPQGQDMVAALAGAGMRVTKVDARTRAVLEELADALGAMLRGPCDFARDTALERLGQIKQRNPRQMLHFRPDPGLLPVFRALIGVYHALKHLEVVGDLGPVVRALVATRS